MRLRRGGFLVLLMLIGCVTTAEQSGPKKEAMTVRVIKVERHSEDRDGSVRHSFTIVFRRGNIVYRARSECVTATTENSKNCSYVSVPKPGGLYVVNYTPTVAQFSFGIDKVSYELETEEVSDCAATPNQGNP